MRSLILLCTIGFLSATISAQNFEIVSTFPVDGAFGVTTDSILITFNAPVFLNLSSDDLTESGFFAAIEPEESFYPDSIALSDDGLTVKFFGSFDDDTDYLLYIMGAESQAGKQLSSPLVIQFTTADTRGEFVIRGRLNGDILDQLEIDDFLGFTAILSHSAPEFNFYEPDDDGDNTESENEANSVQSKRTFLSPIYINEESGDEYEGDEDDITPVYATLIDPLTGEFEITGVREGVYFPLGYNLFEIVEFEEFDEAESESEYDFFFPTTLRYDANGDLGLDSIFVNSADVPSDTLDNIDLTLLDLDPFGIKKAFDIVETTIVVNELGTWEIIGGFAEYKLSRYLDDIYFKSTAKIRDVDPFFFQIVDGTSDVWSIITYDASQDSAAIFIVTPTGAELLDIIGENEVEDSVDFSEIIGVSNNSLSSVEAFNIMLDEGLTAAFNSMVYEFGPGFNWDFEFQLFHEYWNYTPDPTPTAPVTWKGSLFGEYYDEVDQRNYNAEYTIHLDAVTGEVLFEEATEIPDLETISLVDYSFPDGSFDPSGDSLVFEFDGQLNLDLEAEDPENIGFFMFIEPEDSVGFSGIKYDEFDGGSTVTVYVDLTDDTDFVVFLADVNGTEGESLDHAYVLQFSTGNTDGRFTISGYLETPVIDINNYFKNVIVMLVEEEPEFGFDFLGDDGDFFENGSAKIQDDNGDGDEEDFFPLYAANVDPESGYFEISLIREGNYYPIAFNIIEDEVESDDEFFIPKIFYYDSNEDRFPDILEINNTTAPSDTLSELELSALKFDRFTLSEAIELAERRIEALDIGEVEFAGGNTFFQFYGFEEMELKKGLKNIPEAVIINQNENGPGLNPFDTDLDGHNFIWQLFVYHPDKDSALATFVTPIGAIFVGFIGEEEIGEPIEFDDLKPLPDNYIDSDAAALLFNLKGGADFFEFLQETYEPGTYSWSHEIQALHEYWDYPFDSSPDAPVTWKASYKSDYYDGITDESYTDSLVIYLDIETGELLYFDLTVDSEIEAETPDRIQLGQNYPNPFNPSTNIPFQLSKSSVVNISVFNLLGQKVATLANELYSEGRHTIAWNASSYSSGIYFYRLTAGDIIQTKKLMLIK